MESKTELDELALRIKNGETVNEIINDNPSYKKYMRTLKELEERIFQKNERTKMTVGVWIYDPNNLYDNSVLNNIPENSTTYYKKDRDWWDDYRQEDIVIFTDYTGEKNNYMMCDIIDRWPCSVSRRKKSPIPFNSKVVIVISRLLPRQAYKKSDENDYERLLRRVKIYEIHKSEDCNIIPTWDHIFDCWNNEQSL